MKTICGEYIWEAEGEFTSPVHERFSLIVVAPNAVIAAQDAASFLADVMHKRQSRIISIEVIETSERLLAILAKDHSVDSEEGAK